MFPTTATIRSFAFRLPHMEITSLGEFAKRLELLSVPEILRQINRYSLLNGHHSYVTLYKVQTDDNHTAQRTSGRIHETHEMTERKHG